MNEGFWRFGDDGRPMYTEDCGACGLCAKEPWNKQNTYREEFIGQMIDTVEDFLERNSDYFHSIQWAGIENSDDVILSGHWFDTLEQDFSELLTAWAIDI